MLLEQRLQGMAQASVSQLFAAVLADDDDVEAMLTSEVREGSSWIIRRDALHRYIDEIGQREPPRQRLSLLCDRPVTVTVGLGVSTGSSHHEYGELTTEVSGERHRLTECALSVR
ncbi:MAG TPA: hypothetical protein VFN54_01715 [Acidimicrobiales bacterium]|nr:hypothetical protein [Acidimicrobiales bacterium]